MRLMAGVRHSLILYRLP